MKERLSGRRQAALKRAARLAVLLITTAIWGAAPAQPVRAAPSDEPDYLALYRQGATFATFLERARVRREDWRQRYKDATVTPDLVTRLRALPSRRLILLVAEDWCSDSLQSVPHVARLVDAGPERLELRIIDATVGRAVMEAHLTPDGRAATPTLVILQEDGSPIGAWVERASTVQAWFLEQQKSVMQQPLREQLRKWYAEDAGRTTMAEIAALLER